jgi:hypothetical protein
MANPVLKFYYDEIKKEAGSKGKNGNAVVDNFWNNMLRHYFTVERDYGIELEPRRPLEEGMMITKPAVDFTIRRIIRTGEGKKVFVVVVVFMENGKVVYEMPTSSWWAAAVDQLTEYLKVVRAEQTRIGEDAYNLYGAVAIGTFVRFYCFEPVNDGELRGYPLTQETGQAFELKGDEEEIHKVLNEFVAGTSQ